MSPNSLAAVFVDDYYACYRNTGLPTTYSAIRLDYGFDLLVNSFSAFAEALLNTGDMHGVYRAWSYTTGFSWPENKDLYSFANEIIKYSNDQNVKNAAAALKTAFKTAVVRRRETGGCAGKAYGISILLPNHKRWGYYSQPEQYMMLKLPQLTKWDEFIVRFANYTGSVAGPAMP